jgi:hypothetical protein
MINSQEEFQAEKSRLLTETAAANKRAEEAQTKKQQLLLDNQLETAYSESGGIGTDTEAYQAIKSILKIELENGEIVIKDRWGETERNADGTAKSVKQKMAELKQHPTFKGFFSGDGSSSQDGGNSQQTEPKTYTRDQARNGKVSMDDIAAGKLKLEGVDESPKPDAKVVSASLMANLKKRNWF